MRARAGARVRERTKVSMVQELGGSGGQYLYGSKVMSSTILTPIISQYSLLE